MDKSYLTGRVDLAEARTHPIAPYTALKQDRQPVQHIPGARQPLWWLPGLLVCAILVVSGLLLLNGLRPVYYLGQSLWGPRLPNRTIAVRAVTAQHSGGVEGLAVAPASEVQQVPTDLIHDNLRVPATALMQPALQHATPASAAHVPVQTGDASDEAQTAPTPPTPPGPAESHWGTRPYPPGITAEILEQAEKKLEELTAQPSAADHPDQPWHRRPANYTLFRIDEHVRHNPSYRAESEFGDKMFVKFPCLPGQEGMEMGGLCKHGIPEGIESVPLRHQASIQKVSDACGFDNLKSHTWNAPVYGVTPEGHVIDGQTGFFAEWMDGQNPEKMKLKDKAGWISRIPIEWIWWAALHDLIMCESDRHQANLVVHDDATFRFIDNDHELNNRMVMGTSLITSKDAGCMPNSIFLPHTLETWRVWKFKMPLSKLDMRCWTGPEMDIPIPSRIRSCLDHFSTKTAEELLVEYDMVRLEIAESLHQRSKDLLELGFWRTLLRTVQPNEPGFWWHPQRLKWEEGQFPHWRGSLWRPLQEPNCTLGLSSPEPEGAGIA